MRKYLALLSVISSTLMLTGCATQPSSLSGIELPEPRPKTDKSSRAMEVASFIRTTVNCLGCKDTVLWADEKDHANKMVFDTKRNTRLAYAEARAYMDEVNRLRRDGKLTAETLPKPPRIMLNPAQSSSGTLTNSLMLADSLDGRWTNSSSSLGTGLAFAAVGMLFSSVHDENLKYPPTDYLKAAFVLPPDNQIRFEKEVNDPKRKPEQNRNINLGIYAGKQFVQLLTKAAIDMGFTPVGDMVVDFVGDPSPTNAAWTDIYQILENDKLGCPKYDPKNPGWKKQFGYCRVQWGPYHPIGVQEAHSWKVGKAIVPEVLGGNGKTERLIYHFGYNQQRAWPLVLNQSKLSQNEQTLLEQQFVLSLQKYLKSGQVIYVPSFKYVDANNKEKRSPQCVLDHKGIHYFSVVVPEHSLAPVTPVPSATKNTETEENAGLNGLLNKIANF